jgi:hypothetical protein
MSNPIKILLTDSDTSEVVEILEEKARAYVREKNNVKACEIMGIAKHIESQQNNQN